MINIAGNVMLIVALVLPVHIPGVPSLQVDICKIYGSVYVEKNPRFADYRVYVEDSEAFCDVIVFQSENRLFADRPGLWHFTSTKGFEDFSIYYEKDRGLADFTIFLTETESFAGCNR